MNVLSEFENKFLIFDGGMGTMLQNYGLEPGELPEIYNITHPEIVEKIHRMYADAGADVILNILWKNAGNSPRCLRL